jgi:biopolymer transport protein ExbD
MKIGKYKKNKFKLDMAPLIDVVFLLLIFFMLTFAISGQAMDIKLPQGQAASSAPVQEDITVRISAEGDLLLDNKSVKLDDLGLALKTKLDAREEKNRLVKIEPDKKTKYKRFATVLDYARVAGAKDFSIVR